MSSTGRITVRRAERNTGRWTTSPESAENAESFSHSHQTRITGPNTARNAGKTDTGGRLHCAEIDVFAIDLFDRLNRKNTYYTLAIHKKHRCVKQGPLSKCGQTPAANDHWKIA